MQVILNEHKNIYSKLEKHFILFLPKMPSSKSLQHSGYNVVLGVKVEQLFPDCGACYVSSDEC